MEKTLTKKELAAVAGYTYRRLHEIDKDLPEKKKLFVEAEDGKFDLCTFVQRWVEYNVEKECGTEMALEDAKAIHEQVKIQKTQLEVAKLRGELVDVNDVRRLWAIVANTVVQNMLRLPSRIAQQVLGIENAEVISGVIEKEIRLALEAVADTPIPGAGAAADKGEEELEDEG